MCAICEPPPPLSDESTPGTGATSPDGPPQHHSDPVRIIHKEQDSISAFCLNQVSYFLSYRSRYTVSTFYNIWLLRSPYLTDT